MFLTLSYHSIFTATFLLEVETHLNARIRNYQQFLKNKYESLELISIDEQLDCSSSKYISLTLEKMDRQGRVILAVDRDKKGDDVTLSEALDIGGDRKGVTIIVIKGGPGMYKSTLVVNICKWKFAEFV